MASNPEVGSSDAGDCRPSKRSRTDGVESEPVIIRSPQFWFDSGDIIVRTKAPSVHALYKVHKEILSLHCSAFAALFDGPQAAFDVSETYEGVPIMDLPESEVDILLFLSALYLPRATQRHPRIADPYTEGAEWFMTPASYSSILRLATKYDAADIRDIIIEALSTEWPTSLSAWDHLQSRTTQLQRSGRRPEEEWTMYPAPENAIRLALDCQVPDILPVAFYDLACALETETSGRSVDLSMLDAEELRKILHGRRELRHRFSVLIGVPPGTWSSPGHICVRKKTVSMDSPCERAIRDWWKRCHTFIDAWRPCDPLDSLLRTYEDCGHLQDGDVCLGCRMWLQDRITLMRTTLWKNLPNIFDLNDEVSEDWGTLGDYNP